MRHRPLEFYLGLWTLVLVAATGVVLLADRAIQRTAPKPALTLRAADQGTRIRVDWDAANPQVQSAESGLLEVQDGEAFHRYPVEKRVLQNGGLDYIRKSPDVFLTLTILREGRPADRATVRTIAAVRGPVADPEPPPRIIRPTTTRSRRR